MKCITCHRVAGGTGYCFNCANGCVSPADAPIDAWNLEHITGTEQEIRDRVDRLMQLEMSAASHWRTVDVEPAPNNVVSRIPVPSGTCSRSIVSSMGDAEVCIRRMQEAGNVAAQDAWQLAHDALEHALVLVNQAIKAGAG